MNWNESVKAIGIFNKEKALIQAFYKYSKTWLISLPRLGMPGGPKPRGLCARPGCAGWGCLVSGSGLRLLYPFSRCSASFRSSSCRAVLISGQQRGLFITFFLLRCRWVIMAWSLSFSCNTTSVLRADDYTAVKNTLESAETRRGWRALAEFIFLVSLPNGDNTSCGLEII